MSLGTHTRTHTTHATHATNTHQALYITPFLVTRTLSSRCYFLALAAALGGHVAALYSRHGMPKMNVQYLAQGMEV